MRAVVYKGPGDKAWEEVPDPRNPHGQRQGVNERIMLRELLRRADMMVILENKLDALVRLRRLDSLSSATSSPLLMMMTRSQIASTSCRICDEKRTVLFFPKFLITSLISII